MNAKSGFDLCLVIDLLHSVSSEYLMKATYWYCISIGPFTWIALLYKQPKIAIIIRASENGDFHKQLAKSKQAILGSFESGWICLSIDRHHFSLDNYKIRINGMQHLFLTQSRATIMIAPLTKITLEITKRPSSYASLFRTPSGPQV